jgi:DNA-binding NtrC family response regulator/tetratricopeptide (TPR) repeat protein
MARSLKTNGGGASLQEKRTAKVISEAAEMLDGGLGVAAEKLLSKELDSYRQTPDSEARLSQMLSYALEIQGRYQDALETLRPFQSDSALEDVSPEIRLALLNQLAVCHSNLVDLPIAVAILKKCLAEAERLKDPSLLGTTSVSFSRVYRKLSEAPIARDHAQNALKHFRETGDWRGMAEAYMEIGGAWHLEGNSRKAIEFFQLAIQIIGDREAPFQLGKVYSDLAGAYWFLRKPKDGVACLERSIEFFGRTEHRVQTVAAYNNLGINLILLGEWTRAEEAIGHALELATELDHSHLSGVLDSLGELKMMRGNLDEARSLFERAVAVAEEKKREWYAIQAMCNLAKCLLLEGRAVEAREKALETLSICERIGETQIANMARLVLAESYLTSGDNIRCMTELETIEATDPSSELFVLGSVQRIRGLALVLSGDLETGTYHLSRALTIFETAEDAYQIGLANYNIGKALRDIEAEKAARHLSTAVEIFRRLGAQRMLTLAEGQLEPVRSAKPPKSGAQTAGSQLLLLRLAEATASRELLFRELVAVLQQESRARKIVVAEANDRKHLQPFLTQGYTPDESVRLANAANEALIAGDLGEFAKTKNLAIFPLRAPNAPLAMLLIYPRAGAVLNDGSSIDPLLRVVSLGMDVCALRDKDRNHSTEEDASPYTSNSLMPGFIHSSPAMTSLVEEVYKIRSSDVTVLVTGESGTGKELVSRAIHAISNRKDRVFIPFNCTAVPKELAEGHLFGYKKGAFTGAVNDSPGMIRAAHGGTLFLDEIGDLPLDVQPKLLRFLQEGEVQPLGERSPVKVDVRVIAATNMPLEQKVADGTFREDLYYRLNVIRLRVPPLRERRSEIPPMVNYYLNHYSARFGKKDVTITPQTIDLLMVCEWEGNVRQLCNEIQRLVARAEDGEVITPDHLSSDLKRSASPLMPSGDSPNVRPISSSVNFGGYNFETKGATLEQAVSELERQMITDSLRRHDWNISRVSRELGLTRRGLYLKLARYGIEKSA